ncbi:LppP/LprE family lipoprotein [Nocardia heshunensis]
MVRHARIVLSAIAVLALAGCGNGDGTAARPTPSAVATALTTAAASTSVTTSGPAQSTAAGSGDQACKPDPAVVRNAAASLAPVEVVPGKPWKWALPAVGANPTVNGICSGLSAALISIEGATASSPMQVLLFHRGGYVGTAEPTWNSFISPDPAHTTDDSVGLRFKIPGSCDACADGTFYCVQYRWDGAKVVSAGRPPRVMGTTVEPGTMKC